MRMPKVRLLRIHIPCELKYVTSITLAPASFVPQVHAISAKHTAVCTLVMIGDFNPNAFP